ncbi:MAG: response regulator [Euryarchaeota archaeon]|nr:response regulator [Euryarchaeota archaeon]
MTQKLRSILIINREPDLAALYAEMLSMSGEKYMLNMAYTAKDCLLFLKKHLPNLILLDIELDDMNGWELIEKIKLIGPDIPLIVITARPPGIEDFTRLTMVCDYIARPVTLDCLHMAVKDAMEVPVILNKCIEKVRNSPAKDKLIFGVEENIRLMKQSIIDRKIFILMRQIYPDNRDPNAKILLDNLKEKINRAQNELETFKTRECLLSNIIL